MSVNPGDNQSVTLLSLDLIMEQSEDMALFSITEKMLVNVNQPKNGIKMTIKMKRKIMSEMMTTYLPLPSLLRVGGFSLFLAMRCF